MNCRPYHRFLCSCRHQVPGYTFFAFFFLMLYSLPDLLTFAALNRDALYMKRCFELARMGAGYVAPNPMVGAVLVYNDIIIGEGYHQQYGLAHAEVNCINSVKAEHRSLVSSGTLYVSLEPCAHFGRTPPCADLIIEYKIPKVVIACRDAFAKVNGQGILKLRTAGIEVTEGILEEEALELNKRFFCFHKNQRPYIILKWAQTADGFIARENYDSVAISNDLTNRWVHQMRANESAIMVGTNTVLHDNPSLTTRLWPGKNPLRIFIDKQLKAGGNAAVFNKDAEVIVMNELAERQEGHIHFAKISNTEKLLPQLMQLLFEKNITSLIVEGGSFLLQSFVEEGLWDEAWSVTNETLQLQSGIPAMVLPAEKKGGQMYISTDRVDHYLNK